MLLSRGVAVSEEFPFGVPGFAAVPEAVLVQAALACGSERDFRARIARSRGETDQASRPKAFSFR